MMISPYRLQTQENCENRHPLITEYNLSHQTRGPKLGNLKSQQTSNFNIGKKNVNETVLHDESFGLSPDRKNKGHSLCYLEGNTEALDSSNQQQRLNKPFGNSHSNDSIFPYQRSMGHRECDHRAARNFSCLSSIEIS